MMKRLSLTHRAAEHPAELLLANLEVVERIFLAVALQDSPEVLAVLVDVLRAAVRQAVHPGLEGGDTRWYLYDIT